MKRALNLLFLAGILALLVPAHPATATQASAQAPLSPQAKTANRGSSHDRHHSRHNNTTRRHRHHKSSSKH
jgi:hypothetical protein